MVSKSAIQRLKTKWTDKKVFAKTPKTKKTSKAKAVSDFYGSPIRKGLLHKRLGVKQGEKISLRVIEKRLSELKKKKKKTAKDLKKEKELVFAKNAKTKFNK